MQVCLLTSSRHGANSPAPHRTGGIGVIGGLRQSPKILQDSINEIKSHLEDPNAPFGVDLLIPQVGGQARKTNVSNSKLMPI